MTPVRKEKVGLNIFYITALGASARSFLIPHFLALRKEGHKLSLLCSDDQEAQDVITTTNIGFYPIPLSSSISPLNDIFSVLRLCQYFRTYQPDVMHAHMSKAGFVSLIAGYICRVRVRIYHNHGMACFSSTGVRKIVLSMIERINCTLATEVLFCSNSTKEEAIRRGLCNAKKVLVLGKGTISGVAVEEFSPANAAFQSHKIFQEFSHLSLHRKYVSFVGRVVPHKGVDTLLSAWANLSNEIKETHSLIIAGDNDGDALSMKG